MAPRQDRSHRLTADLVRFERAHRGEAAIHAPVLGAAGWEFSPEWLEELRAGLEAALDAADPLDPGVSVPTEPWAREVLAQLPFERRGSRVYRPGATGSLGERAAAALALEQALAEAEPAAVKIEDPELARFLEREGRLVRLGAEHAVSPAAYERARSLLLEECSAAGRITLARLRDLVGCGRRDAQLLLERFDADGLTRRVGDERVLRRAALPHT